MEAPTTTTTTKVEVFPCLEELSIFNCPSIGFIPIPLTSLRELRIHSCKTLSSIGLPSSQGLPYLRKLIIVECDGLSALPSGIENCTSLELLHVSSCGNLATNSFTRVLPSLRELQIHSCKALFSIGLTSSQGLPYLRKLIIVECAGLSALPSGIENCTSLELLHVNNCKNLATISFTRVLPSLRELRVGYCDNLSCLAVPEYCQELSVIGCPKLASITFSTDLNPCLEDLRIENCNGLQSLADFRSFTSLRSLWLGPFREDLDSFPDFQVPSQQLVKLWLKGWPKLKSLPQQVQHLTSLTSLTIRSFEGVETSTLHLSWSCVFVGVIISSIYLLSKQCNASPNYSFYMLVVVHF